MYYEVYIDVFFVVNALLDFFILLLVKKLQHYKSSMGRMVLAAMAGSGCLSLYLCLPARRYLIVRTLFYLAAYAGMERIAFPDNSIKGRIQAAVSLYAASLLVNGICHWLNLSFVHVWQLLLGGIGLYGAIVLCHAVYMRMTKQEQSICDVQIIYNKKRIRVKGLWDTGNCLQSPYHGRGVSVICYDAVREYMPDMLRKSVETGCAAESLQLNGLFYIPYETVGCRKCLMPMIEAQRMYIQTEKGQMEYLHPLLGISKDPVSSQNTFQIILTPAG